MRDGEDDRGATASHGPKGLSSCTQCQGIFPAAKLTAHDGKLLCADCNRKFGPLDADGRSVAQDAAPAQPSYGARMVASSVTGDPVAVSRQFGGRYEPRPTSLTGATGGLDGEPSRMHGAPPPIPAPPDFATPAAGRAPSPAARASSIGPSGHLEPSRVAGGRISQSGQHAGGAAPPPLTRQDRGSNAMPPWAQQAPGAPHGPGTSAGAAPPDPLAAPAPPRISQRGGQVTNDLDAPVRPVLSQSRFPSWQGAPPVRTDSVAPAPPPAMSSAASAAPGAPDARRASQLGPAAASQADRRRVSQFDGDMRRVSHDGARGGDRFEAYAVLRQQIDGGDDTLDTRRRAAEMASRIGLHLEAVEHYRRCCELAPEDQALRLKLENVQRSVGVDRGGAAPPPAESTRRVAEEARPFWEDLGGAVAYPFRGAGVPVLLVGGILFGIGQIIGTINMFAWSVTAMLCGYVAAYLFDVINSTASGKTSPPDLPEASNVLESYVFPFFAYLTCAVVSFVPFVLALWLAGKGWLPSAVNVVLCLAAFALGVFVFPMTLMVRAMFQSISDAANPVIVLGAIGRIFPDYLAMFIATCVLWIAFGIVYSVAWFLTYVTLGAPSPDAVFHLDIARIAAWILFTVLTWPVFLYAWMLQGHLLGRLYRQSLRRLAWFAPATEQSRSARRLSAGLTVAAGVSLLALCGAAWGAGKVFERYRASPNSGSFGLQCPLGDGSKLTYFWEHTDGMAGLTEYAFSSQADGTMRVTATTKLAGRPGEGSVETVGIFDPDTGVFTEAVPVWGQGVHYDGRTGQHVPFFGPKRASLGSTYINDWSIRSSERWQGAWACWKVHQDASTLDLYFDTKTGVLVGSSFGGVGFKITAWLVEAHNVAGVANGPPANRNFNVTDGGMDDFNGLPVPRDAPDSPYAPR